MLPSDIGGNALRIRAYNVVPQQPTKQGVGVSKQKKNHHHFTHVLWLFMVATAARQRFVVGQYLEEGGRVDS